jgi:hypothetical protein
MEKRQAQLQVLVVFVLKKMMKVYGEMWVLKDYKTILAAHHSQI